MRYVSDRWEAHPKLPQPPPTPIRPNLSIIDINDIYLKSAGTIAVSGGAHTAHSYRIGPAVLTSASSLTSWPPRKSVATSLGSVDMDCNADEVSLGRRISSVVKNYWPIALYTWSSTDVVSVKCIMTPRRCSPPQMSFLGIEIPSIRSLLYSLAPLLSGISDFWKGRIAAPAENLNIPIGAGKSRAPPHGRGAAHSVMVVPSSLWSGVVSIVGAVASRLITSTVGEDSAAGGWSVAWGIDGSSSNAAGPAMGAAVSQIRLISNVMGAGDR